MTPALVLWSVATIVHVGLTVRVARRWSANRDDLLLFAAIGTTGGLLVVLHAAALTTGISVPAVACGLGLWHGLWWRFTRGDDTAPRFDRPTAAERIATVVWISIGLSWLWAAMQSNQVSGPDAAHYHVPHALNFSAGMGLFDLPATPHLYPMAASVVTSWFIVPVRSLLLVDLAPLLPFAIVIGAVNMLFRTMTGQSGLAWGSWLGLALFATPMFRGSAVGASDLWFAAGAVACVAVLARVWWRESWLGADFVALGLSSGILIGSKTTGAVFLALLLVTAVAVAIVRRVCGLAPSRWTKGAWRDATLATGLCVAAGGVWLLRNWWQHGSPVAPSGLRIGGLVLFPGESSLRTTYFSVLGEMQAPGFDLRARALEFISRWFGTWFLPALTLVPLILVDLIVSWRRRFDSRWGTRLGVLLIGGPASAVFLYLLVGAPWTALENGQGLSLRYALPIAVLLPALSMVSLFPVSLKWDARAPVRHAVWWALVLVASGYFLRSLGPASDSATGLPTITWWAVPAAAAVYGVGTAFHSRPPIRRGMTGVAAVAVALALAAAVAAADRRVFAEANAAWEAEELSYAGGEPSSSGWREIFLAVRNAERGVRGVCSARRFFSLIRDDEPLALQPPDLSSLVFYAGRDVKATRAAGPIGPCDYIVTTLALEGTDQGRALVEALLGGGREVRVANVGHFVVIGSGS